MAYKIEIRRLHGWQRISTVTSKTTAEKIQQRASVDHPDAFVRIVHVGRSPIAWRRAISQTAGARI